MIRWKSELEAEPEDLVKLMDGVVRQYLALVKQPQTASVMTWVPDPHVRAGPRVSPGPPGDVPDLWASDPVPSSGATPADLNFGPDPQFDALFARATEGQLAEGADMWMGLLTTWQQGFMDEEAEQPDRLAALSSAMTQGGSVMFAALHHFGGMTALVRSLMPNMHKKRARRIAENITQVASAAGIPHLSTYLEYTREYTGKEYAND